MGIDLSNNLKTYINNDGIYTELKATGPFNLTADYTNESAGIELKTTSNVLEDIYKKINKIAEKKEENQMNKYEKILKIYKEREYEYIDQEYIAAKSEIIEKDKIHAIYVEYINKIKEAYEKENKTEMPCMLWNGEDFLTKKTEEKLKEIEKERNLNEHNLEEKLEEIKARLEMTDDYDKQVEILKIYGILNEEGIIDA